MIKSIVKNKLKLVLVIILLFLISYLLHINLAIPLLLICLVIYVKFRGIDLGGHRFLYLNFLFVIIFVSSHFIIKNIRTEWQLFLIPFSVVPMLVSILFNNLELALLITLAAAFSISSITNSYFYLLVLLFVVSGLLGSILVLGTRRRMEVINAGFMIALAQAGVLFFLNEYKVTDPASYISVILNGIISGMFVLGTLPLFEYLFKTVTNISLLELADFNHPLLQRMILEAPGTYHHSLIVGNLSDAACSAIGANALLARIGSYYHDIGKLKKPEYFSENQSLKESKHDALSPSMSKLVIINHVKDGVELAKSHKLNPSLVDFIQQHHGDSLVYYFYRRALENQDVDQEVKEEVFRYPGPRPKTKEAAIVLLADSVEAATRALKEPDAAKIEEVVHKVINNKFIDRQLDECDLTLKDLEKIAEIFIRILNGIYHSRITYPESPGSEDSHKKSSTEDSSQSEQDKEGSS